MLEKVARFGIGLKLPSYHEMRVTFFDKEVKNVLVMLEEFKLEWKRTDCTIMFDSWSEKRRCSTYNFLVNSFKGTVFLSFIDTSKFSKTTDKVFDMLDVVVEKVRPKNVVHIVKDNAANYKAVGEKMENRPTVFRIPCATHCIDLMLEDMY
ncbi:unnamed protein product [Amaranthus hypochondriacus]